MRGLPLNRRGFVGQDNLLAIVKDNLGQFPGILIGWGEVALHVRHSGWPSAYDGSFDHVLILRRFGQSCYGTEVLAGVAR
jgi:hypothetical protein